MAAQFEKTVTATEFKAKCLELMQQVHTGKLRRVRVTKRGKPFVAVESDGVAAEPSKPWSVDSIFGCMKDFPRPVPADHDWNVPLYSDAELDDFIKTTEIQIEEMTGRAAA